MCIRALDYVPPVDVTFFEYLRALITADFDVVHDDKHNYRVSFVEAFRRHGIFPANLSDPSPNTVRTLSVDTLSWTGLDQSAPSRASRSMNKHYAKLLDGLSAYADDCLYLSNRKELFERTRTQRTQLHAQLGKAFEAFPEFASELGLDVKRKFEVHRVNCAMKFSPEGRHIPQVVVSLAQEAKVAADRETGAPAHIFRGGSTLVVDLAVPEVKYRIVKNIGSVTRRKRTAAFVREAAADPLRALFFSPDRREPFAALHALADDGL